MTYLEKLKDPRWQKKRLLILERDEWKCQNCGDNTATLHVHHRWYEQLDPWDAPDAALVTLCETCHLDETELRSVYEKALLNELRQAGLFTKDIVNLYYSVKDSRREQVIERLRIPHE